MSKGFIVIKNKLTGELFHFQLEEFTFNIKNTKPDNYYVYDSNWSNPTEFKVPKEFSYKIEKVTSQLSKLKNIGDRMVATMFNLDTASFRMYISSYSLRNNAKFRTTINSKGDLIIIRKK